MVVSAAGFEEPEPEIVYIYKDVIRYVDRPMVIEKPVVKCRIVEKEVEKIVEVLVPCEPLEYTADDLYCMAAVIYQEAGGDECDDDCRVKVADVVLNRKNDSRFPNTIREVLEAKNQYGKFWQTGVRIPNRGDSEEETRAIARAWYIAAKVLGGYHSELYGNGYVWQAEFEQGKDIVYTCGTYFGR